MESVFSFGREWNFKSVSLFVVLLVLPNILGLINIATPWGFKIHFFQIGIFLAALLYGAPGGFLAGLVGSTYSAFIMHNPYIAFGNALLGMFVGVFACRKIPIIGAVWLAFLIQLPWLVLTDHFLVGLSWAFIVSLVIALAISNTIWGVVAGLLAKPVEEIFK